jgi:uncharacterized protein YkwD
MTRRSPLTTPIHRSRLLALAARILLCIVAPAAFIAACSDEPTAPSYEYASMEDQVLAGINAHRASLSPALGALATNDFIVEKARQHSKDMADGTVPFSHDGFPDRAAAIGAKIAVVRVGENVAMNAGYGDPPAIAVQGWLMSPPHKANIEGDFNLTGVGVARAKDGSYYFTQIFAKSQ